MSRCNAILLSLLILAGGAFEAIAQSVPEAQVREMQSAACTSGATVSTSLRGTKERFSIRIGEMTGFMMFRGCAPFSELPGDAQKAAERLGYKPGDNVSFLVFKDESEIVAVRQTEIAARQEEAPVRWVLKKTLLSVGMDLPEPAGAKLDEIADFAPPVWLSSGDLIFWGRHGKEWDVYRWHDGRITPALDMTVPQEDRTRVALTVQFWAKSGLPYPHYFRQPPAGEDGLFAFAPVNRWNCGTVYRWNGSAFAKVIGSQDRVEIEGTESALECVTLLGVAPGPQAIVFYTTIRPKKGKGVALLDSDGRGLKPLWFDEEPLPGLPHLRVGGVSPASKPPVVLGNAIVAPLHVAGIGSAIVRFSEGKTEKLMGGMHPLLPQNKLYGLDLYDVSDADTFVANATVIVRATQGPIDTLLMYDEEKCYNLFDLPWKEAGWTSMFLRRGMFLQPGSTRYVYLATVARAENKGRLSLTKLLLADHDKLTDLAPHIRVGDESRLSRGPSGVLLKSQRGVESHSGILIKAFPEYWYLDGADLRLQEFLFSDRWDEIVAFSDPDEIVARTTNRVHLYERVP